MDSILANARLRDRLAMLGVTFVHRGLVAHSPDGMMDYYTTEAAEKRLAWLETNCPERFNSRYSPLRILSQYLAEFGAKEDAEFSITV
jgi:hypothetical protein